MPLDPVRPRPPRNKAFPWPTFVVAAGAALVAIGVFIAVGASKHRASRRDESVSVPPATPSASEQEAALLERLDPDEAYARARSRAHQWDPEAVLAALEIGPFQGGKLAFNGKLEAWFGKPAGATLGPGAGLAKPHLVIRVTASELTQEFKPRASSIGLPDPNCIVQDVWKEVLPAVITHDARITLKYAARARDGRAVWQLLPEGKTTPVRLLDGNSCAFLLQ